MNQIDVLVNPLVMLQPGSRLRQARIPAFKVIRQSPLHGDIGGYADSGFLPLHRGVESLGRILEPQASGLQGCAHGGIAAGPAAGCGRTHQGAYAMMLEQAYEEAVHGESRRIDQHMQSTVEGLERGFLRFLPGCQVDRVVPGKKGIGLSNRYLNNSAVGAGEPP